MATNLDARLAGYHSPVLSVFRIVFGLLYMMHGSQKLFDWPIPAPAPIDAGVLARSGGPASSNSFWAC